MAVYFSLASALFLLGLASYLYRRSLRTPEAMMEPSSIRFGLPYLLLFPAALVAVVLGVIDAVDSSPEPSLDSAEEVASECGALRYANRLLSSAEATDQARGVWLGSQLRDRADRDAGFADDLWQVCPRDIEAWEELSGLAFRST
jgi:hypothetical protein